MWVPFRRNDCWASLCALLARSQRAPGTPLMGPAGAGAIQTRWLLRLPLCAPGTLAARSWHAPEGSNGCRRYSNAAVVWPLPCSLLARSQCDPGTSLGGPADVGASQTQQLLGLPLCAPGTLAARGVERLVLFVLVAAQALSTFFFLSSCHPRGPMWPEVCTTFRASSGSFLACVILRCCGRVAPKPSARHV